MKLLIGTISVICTIVILFAGQLYFNHQTSGKVSAAYDEYQITVEKNIAEKEAQLEELKKDYEIKDVKGIEIRNIKTNIFDDLNRNQDVRIVFLGDSTTEQNEYTNGKNGHVSNIRNILTELYEPKLEVINSGVAGDTIKDMQKRLDTDVINYYPDLVVINSGINDSASDISNKDFKKTFSEVIEKIQEETNADIILRTSNQTLGKESNEKLEDNINPIVDSLAKKYHLGFIDLYTYYDKVTSADPDGIEKYNFNHSHPNEIGQNIISNLIMYSLLYKNNE